MTENKVWDYVSKKNGKDCLAEQVEKHGKKVVMTNPEMAKHLLARIKFNKGDRVLEPCRGDGAFFNNFPEFPITAIDLDLSISISISLSVLAF